MKQHNPRPKILVSRCLGFAACRYNGQQLSSRIIELMRDHVDFVAVCPEVEAGLGIPRSPIRLCQQNDTLQVWQQAHDRTVTNELQEASATLALQLTGCDGAVLKSKSPSCALRDAKVYRGIEHPQFLRRDSGIFASLVLKVMAEKALEDEQRLTNLVLREHFLVKLYVLARFRTISVKPHMGDLVAFHSCHKLLFLAYNQSRFRICGKIVANHDRLPVDEVFQLYEKEMGHILKHPFRRQSMVNTLYHAFGWTAKQMSSAEKEYLISTIEEYRDERIPLQTVTRLIEAQAIRFSQKNLLGQILLRPFPSQLSDLSDSGNGREIP